MIPYFIKLVAGLTLLEMFVFVGLGVTGVFGGPGLILFFGICVGVPSIVVYRRERRARAGEYDDRLTQERVNAGFDKFLEEVKK